MKLNDLISGLDKIEIIGNVSSEIDGIEYDSRKVKSGSLFVAIQGITVDGNTFIKEAVKRGAAGIITDRPESRADIPTIIVPDARKAMAVIADKFYGNPQNSLIFVSYQVEGTLGRRIQKGWREIPMRINHNRTVAVHVKMQIITNEGFSGHSSRQQIINYIRNAR